MNGKQSKRIRRALGVTAAADQTRTYNSTDARYLRQPSVDANGQPIIVQQRLHNGTARRADGLRQVVRDLKATMRRKNHGH